MYNNIMQVILTHEQADFDALASMLAVNLLDEKAQPVLPARINRNVRNFLNLYGSDFPFMESRDLTPGPIERVFLVDTQSLVTLKGVNRNTDVHVIDHHTGRQDLPAGWEKHFERVGATTTILTDLLREQGRAVEPMQATLLLLGIYEDTGSLTYATTTVRDVKAAAFLLEKGADLNVAAEFLNPALSSAQRRLADRLLENARNLTIHGKQVFISSAVDMEMKEEISTIAHKLRDLLDPDALFLFVQTQEGIRLVARSTTDEVNVARIAHHFGGGGHERAAAALLQPGEGNAQLTLPELEANLVHELERIIKPAVTVEKIMSRRPHLLSPSTSLEEAARLMQRYGYEGYPVVDDGKVVGLLTRRAVDRAISHKLKLTAGSLMEAGDVNLLSTDPVDQLQLVMASTGWGQIPVLDPESRRIIGIVTRTDLLKTLTAAKQPVQGAKHYAHLLEQALSPSRLALLKLIAGFSGSDHQPIYIVGGFVRDLLLERPSPDFDIVVEGDAIQLCRALAQKYGGRVVTHKRFGTSKWQISTPTTSLAAALQLEEKALSDLPESLDFISSRTEFYDRPTALPTVERSGIKLDLHRRDFTINTLALRLDGNHYGELYDYWGGLADLEKKQVRVLHSLSFVDDPTRLLRAVRFEQRFAFHIEKRTLQLMSEARELLHQLSGERIRHEFDLVFSEAAPGLIMQRLQQLDLLTAIHPALNWSVTQGTALEKVLRTDALGQWGISDHTGSTPTRILLAYLVWWSKFDSRVITELGHRLRLPNVQVKAIQTAARLLQQEQLVKDLPPSQFYDLLTDMPVYSLFAVHVLAEDDHFKQKIQDSVMHWSKIVPHTSGHTLRELGVPPGPVYAQILAQIRAALLDGEIKTESEEKELLKRLLATLG